LAAGRTLAISPAPREGPRRLASVRPTFASGCLPERVRGQRSPACGRRTISSTTVRRVRR
jgi:hypothetical protein